MNNIPIEIYLEIFSFLGFKDIFNSRIFNVNKQFQTYFDEYFVYTLEKHINDKTNIYNYLYIVIVTNELKLGFYKEVVDRLSFENFTPMLELTDEFNRITGYNNICSKLRDCNRQCKCISALSNSIYCNLFRTRIEDIHDDSILGEKKIGTSDHILIKSMKQTEMLNYLLSIEHHCLKFYIFGLLIACELSYLADCDHIYDLITRNMFIVCGSSNIHPTKKICGSSRYTCSHEYPGYSDSCCRECDKISSAHYMCTPPVSPGDNEIFYSICGYTGCGGSCLECDQDDDIPMDSIKFTGKQIHDAQGLYWKNLSKYNRWKKPIHKHVENQFDYNKTFSKDTDGGKYWRDFYDKKKNKIGCWYTTCKSCYTKCINCKNKFCSKCSSIYLNDDLQCSDCF